MENNKLKLIGLGLITGFINGIFGSGGGTIIVPAMVFLLNVEDYKAHATAISIILPLSVISTIIYFFHNTIPISIAFKVMIGGFVGSYIGAKILNKIPTNFLRKIFGSVIVYTAIRMIWK